jgi:hypothetical protein
MLREKKTDKLSFKKQPPKLTKTVPPKKGPSSQGLPETKGIYAPLKPEYYL